MGMFLGGGGAVISNHGVIMVQHCHSFAFCSEVVVIQGLAKRVHERVDVGYSHVHPWILYCTFPKIHVSIGNDLSIRQGKNEGK